MPPLKLELAEGWREVAPRSDVPDLLAEMDGRLLHLASDLSVRRDFGKVGPVDCPLALDRINLRAFRYVSKAGFGGGADYSQLRSYDLKTGNSFPALNLPLHQWVLWLLEWIEGGTGTPGQLLGLVASDRTDELGVCIDHHLFALTPGEERVRRRPLCRDAYRPLAFSRKRRELVFSGAEGTYLLSMTGERKQSLPKERCESGEGGSFDPSGAPRVALAGAGLHLWDFESGDCERLAKLGRHPVWSADGRALWYRESSADLHCIDMKTRETTRILAAAGQRERELWFARPASLSRCGRYAAASLTARRLRGMQQNASSGGERERVYRYEHALVIMDLERRELWQAPGPASQVQWLV